VSEGAARRPLDGRTALVTGAGRGTGRAIALRLAGLGADLVLNYVADEAAAVEVAGRVEGLGRRAAVQRADIGVPADVARLADRAGPVDLLVNNAGIGGGLGRMAEVPAGELRRLFEVHTFGALQLAQALLPGMRERERADIVFVSSRAGRSLPRGLGGYAPSKVATEAVAVILAKEERRHGVRVNVVAPGLVDTDMGRALARDAFRAADIRELDARSPFGRVCHPEDVAQAVEFLVTSEYVTGEVLHVDGGPD
jgi:3-oxoacyl-[acyl-carrier protein] reductase